MTIHIVNIIHCNISIPILISGIELISLNHTWEKEKMVHTSINMKIGLNIGTHYCHH